MAIAYSENNLPGDEVSDAGCPTDAFGTLRLEALFESSSDSPKILH